MMKTQLKFRHHYRRHWSHHHQSSSDSDGPRAANSAPSCASLILARALAREGRAILVQTDGRDADLHCALEIAAGGEEREADEYAQPGLAQLLRGEASFAEAIYRDGASRLHLVQAGGDGDWRSFENAGDLGLILDALQATYDFVLLATGADSAAISLAGASDMTVVFAEDGRVRDFLHDDFEAAGVRKIVLAGLDRAGEIVEVAA